VRYARQRAPEKALIHPQHICFQGGPAEQAGPLFARMLENEKQFCAAIYKPLHELYTL
jgi:hypothetical protein